jgi:hypothetical protein
MKIRWKEWVFLKGLGGRDRWLSRVIIDAGPESRFQLPLVSMGSKKPPRDPGMVLRELENCLLRATSDTKAIITKALSSVRAGKMEGILR